MKFCARAFICSFSLLCLHIAIRIWCFNNCKENYKGTVNLQSNNFGLRSETDKYSSKLLYLQRTLNDSVNNCSTDIGFKTILFFNEPDFKNARGRNDVIYKDCECKNCIISHNKSKLLTADAVIFYIGIRNERMGKYPPVHYKNRNPNQAWIFTSAEPPEHYYNIDYKSPFWRNTMNWSCLYRLDSDIPNPYGYLIRSDEFNMLDYESMYDKKTRNALWIVSHCHVASARRKFILEMISNGFDVDILGSCSQDGQKVDGDKLLQIVSSYKFYLAFENSLCVDYITEKYFNYYNFSWILIVRGGANYNYLLPKDTYINTADFQNNSMLVQYLLELGNDRSRYMNYLKNKNKYISIRWPGNMHCEICRRLNNINQFRKSYADLDTYLNKKQCDRPKDLERISF